jgi:hypothetical protein
MDSDSNENNQERRRDVRAYASPPAHILKNGGVEQIEILNASYRGLFMRTPNGVPPINEILKLEVQLPLARVIINVIPVRVVTDEQGKVTGVGARFFALNGEDKRVWESYISSLLMPRRMAA